MKLVFITLFVYIAKCSSSGIFAPNNICFANISTPLNTESFLHMNFKTQNMDNWNMEVLDGKEIDETKETLWGGFLKEIDVYATMSLCVKRIDFNCGPTATKLNEWKEIRIDARTIHEAWINSPENRSIIDWNRMEECIWLSNQERITSMTVNARAFTVCRYGDSRCLSRYISFDLLYYRPLDGHKTRTVTI